MTRRTFHVVWIVIAALFAACDSKSDPVFPTFPGGTGQSTDHFIGTWEGSMTDNAAGQGSLTLVLVDGALSSIGVWTAVIGGQTVTASLSALSYLPSGTADVVHTLTARCPDNPLGFLLVTVAFDGNRMSGPYQEFGCPAFSTGSIDVVKQ